MRVTGSIVIEWVEPGALPNRAIAGRVDHRDADRTFLIQGKFRVKTNTWGQRPLDSHGVR